MEKQDFLRECIDRAEGYGLRLLDQSVWVVSDRSKFGIGIYLLENPTETYPAVQISFVNLEGDLRGLPIGSPVSQLAQIDIICQILKDIEPNLESIEILVEPAFNHSKDLRVSYAGFDGIEGCIASFNYSKDLRVSYAGFGGIEGCIHGSKSEEGLIGLLDSVGEKLRFAVAKQVEKNKPIALKFMDKDEANQVTSEEFHTQKEEVIDKYYPEIGYRFFPRIDWDDADNGTIYRWLLDTEEEAFRDLIASGPNGSLWKVFLRELLRNIEYTEERWNLCKKAGLDLPEEVPGGRFIPSFGAGMTFPRLLDPSFLLRR